MSKKILIPRKDHEVYIIVPPDDVPLKKSAIRRFVLEKLPELHPGFSLSSVYDIQTIKQNTKCRVIVTVMERNILIEYQMLNPHCAFFTPTSLLLHAPTGRDMGLYQFSDERIGFRPDDGEPVSEPVASDGVVSPENIALLNQLLQTASARFKVFRKQTSVIIFLAPLFLFLAICTFFIMYQVQKNQNVPAIQAMAPKPVIQVIPEPFKILCDIADMIVQAGGVLLQWKYEEASNPVIFFHTQGATPDRLIELFNKYTYMQIQTLSDIQYAGNRPSYTVSIALNLSEYTIPPYRNAENQEYLLSIASLVRTKITEANAIITSESLPNLMDGKMFCTMIFTCRAADFVPILEVLEQTNIDTQLHVPYLNIIFEKQTGVFYIAFSFTPRETGFDSTPSGEQKNAILSAFGYSPPAEPIRNLSPTPIQAVQSEKPNITGYIKIGVIKQDDGETYVYYRTPEGKTIILQEEQ